MAYLRKRGWEITITRNGVWPFPWQWEVWHREDPPEGYRCQLRTGGAVSKRRALRKAVKAKLSMERDDIVLVDDQGTLV